MIAPQVQWVAPAPLWGGYSRAGQAEDRGRMRRPEILRFATDGFMDEFMGALANQPERLHEWRARPETWEAPAPQPGAVAVLPPLARRVQRLRLASASLDGNTAAPVPSLSGTVAAGETLKLYQPGHQRFYLVTACLVCRLPGLPDRMLDFGNGERVGYVVRRLRPKAGAATLPQRFDLESCDEYAFVEGGRWSKADEAELAPGEELLPLFPVSFTEADGRRRRVLAGAIPVGKRESYLGAAAASILPLADAPTPVDPRKAVLMRKVTDPWRSLIDEYERAQRVIAVTPIGESLKLRAAAQDEANLLSWLTLLDLGEYLAKYLKPVSDVVTGAATESSLNGQLAARALYDAMKGATHTSGGTTRSLVQALRDVEPFRESLESNTVPYSTAAPASGEPAPPTAPPGTFPSFFFPLHAPSLKSLVVQPSPPVGQKTLDDLVVDALASAAAPARVPALPLAAAMSTVDRREPGWFVIRCVFERPNCLPVAGRLLSEPTEPFQMASFFDPDAPARPIRISLPWDTTAAGLRKFDKNTAFMVSDALCAQMRRAQKGLTLGDLVMSVLPFPFHKDLPGADAAPCTEEGTGISIGLICSLSIPIITICAFLLLIIIVNLLNIIFHWIPFFISCFPLPRISAKEDPA
jgi:hypothetical protein